MILAPTGTYAQFVPFNLVKDTVRQIWSFDAFLHNLLQHMKVADDGSGSGIIAAIQALDALPQVQIATFDVLLDGLYLRPNDGGDYKGSTQASI